MRESRRDIPGSRAGRGGRVGENPNQQRSYGGSENAGAGGGEAASRPEEIAAGPTAAARGARTRCAPRLKPEGASGGGGRRGWRGLASGGRREEAAGGGEAAVARLSDRLRCPWVPRARLARSRHPAINSGTGRGGPDTRGALLERAARLRQGRLPPPRQPGRGGAGASGPGLGAALRSVSRLRDCGQRGRGKSPWDGPEPGVSPVCASATCVPSVWREWG